VDRILAIVTLRMRLAFRKLRGGEGALRLVGALVGTVLSAVLALGLSVGFAFLVYSSVTGGEARQVRISYFITFYMFFFLGVILPLMRGAVNPGLDVAPFRIFPMSRVRLFGITLAASFGNAEHLLYYPAIVTVLAVGVVSTDAGFAGDLVLVLLALLFFVSWGNTLSLFLVTVMRARRVREILAIGGLLLLVSVTLLPALLENPERDFDEVSVRRLGAAFMPVVRVAQHLPPGLAADGLASLHGAGNESKAVRNAVWLLLWDVGGIVLGYLVFSRYHLGGSGNRGRGKPRSTAEASPSGSTDRLLSFDNRLFSVLPVEVRAVAAKDLRYLLRSVVGKFNLVMIPVFVIIAAFVVGRQLTEPVLGIDPQRVVLFGMLFYMVLFSNNFVNNTFAWEADGVKCYFTGPISPIRVLAGKNIAVWIYNAALFFISMGTWIALVGFPGMATLLSAALVFAAALLIFTSVGNVVSVLFPAARDISSMKNTPSQVGVLLSIASLFTLVLVVGPFISVPMLLGWGFLQPVALAALLVLLVFFYRLSLGMAGRLMGDRREKLIETLGSST